MPIQSTIIPKSTAEIESDLADHNEQHESGGADEIDVSGLTGLPSGGLATYTDEVGSRAFATDYTNGSGGLMLVFVSIQLITDFDAGDFTHAIAKSDSNTPPTTQVAKAYHKCATASGSRREITFTLAFAVKIGEKYRIDTFASSGTNSVTLINWLEITV